MPLKRQWNLITFCHPIQLQRDNKFLSSVPSALENFRLPSTSKYRSVCHFSSSSQFATIVQPWKCPACTSQGAAASCCPPAPRGSWNHFRGARPRCTPAAGCPPSAGSAADRRETPGDSWRRRWAANSPPPAWAAIAAPCFPRCGQNRHHPASRTQSLRYQLNKNIRYRDIQAVNYEIIQCCGAGAGLFCRSW